MRQQQKNNPFGNTIEAIMYPFLLLSLLWSIFLVEQFYPKKFIEFGILPKTLSGLKGVIFSPLIHSPRDVMHLVNNSIPTAILFGALVYFYQKIAAKIFFISWFASGFLVWAIAENSGSYHIGFSGVIYALAAFLFTSGTFRRIRQLQGVSLFVVFVYGSMIWGIFPQEERVSWEGHLFGLLTGAVLAFLFRNQGPKETKFQYEIEKELGIEPIDLEGIWRENVRLAQEHDEFLKRQFEENQKQIHSHNNIDIITGEEIKIRYEFKPKEEE
ncbi:MAG: rhomboid family intramembrane serine protease [Bacteroidota bacterium]